MNRYQSIRCGLWIIILNASQKVIGDCGITIQNIDGIEEHEIGYHLNKNIGEMVMPPKRLLQLKIMGSTRWDSINFVHIWLRIIGHLVRRQNGMV